MQRDVRELRCCIYVNYIPCHHVFIVGNSSAANTVRGWGEFSCVTTGLFTAMNGNWTWFNRDCRRSRLSFNAKSKIAYLYITYCERVNQKWGFSAAGAVGQTCNVGRIFKEFFSGFDVWLEELDHRMNVQRVGKRKNRNFSLRVKKCKKNIKPETMAYQLSESRVFERCKIFAQILDRGR